MKYEREKKKKQIGKTMWRHIQKNIDTCHNQSLDNYIPNTLKIMNKRGYLNLGLVAYLVETIWL